MMKKIIIGITTIFVFAIFAIIIIRLDMPISSVTIKNVAGDSIPNVVISYGDHVENIGTIENNKSVNTKVHTKGETGVMLSYESIGEETHKSRELYLESRGYHIIFIVYPKGIIEEDLELKRIF